MDTNVPAKLKVRRKVENNGDNEVARGYLSWTLQMDRMLADILRDQRSLSHKNDGGWKSVAYNTAASQLSNQFNIFIVGDNVKYRIKSWKKWYGIVSDILSQSGFDWDETKCMITVDNEVAWNEYVKSHKDANGFRFKAIPNWDDSVDLCAKDQATGHGAENAIEADNIMRSDSNSAINIEECEVEFPPKETQGSTHLPTHVQRKRGISSSHNSSQKKRKDELAVAVSKIAEYFSAYILSTEKKIDVKEVMDELHMLPDFDREKRLKALKWLTENETQFSVVKNLPLDEKKDYILMFLD